LTSPSPSPGPSAEWTAEGRRRRILSLALPIIGGMVSQNVLNLVDTAMVGELGDGALAAVGFGSFLNFLVSSFILGLGTGVQAMAARRVGEGRLERAAVPLNAGLLLAIGLAVPWSGLLYWATPHVYPFLNDDPAVVQQGIPYLQARLVGMAALGMNFAFRGYWNAIGRSVLYMRTLLVMHTSNIVLNWVFIFGNLGAPELGAPGAGVASALAAGVGTASYAYLGIKNARSQGFLRALPAASTFATIARVGAPTGVQQMFFAGGMTALFWIIGQVGTSELAAAHVLMHLTLVGILPGLGFGLASATLVGQALGREDPSDARRWGWAVARLAAVVVGGIALPAIVVPQWLLGVFIHDPQTLALAVTPLRVVALSLSLDAVGMVLMHSLMGAGDTRRTMMVSVTLQWLAFLPVAYWLGPHCGFGLTAIWLAQIAYRLVQGGVFAALWQRGRWAHVRV
jgi:putative MATE family efflux protein